MSINLTVNQFEDVNLFSNKNMEKIVGAIINNSSNGVLINMGEDSVIILDHTEGQFHIADYDFDRKNLILRLENFETIELNREKNQFEDSVYDYFENDESDVTPLVDSYKSNVLNQDKYINELINDSMSRKNFDDYVDYNAIKEAVKETDLESVNRPFFEVYKERLISHPLTEIKMFNWEDEVIVSLVETENVKLVNRGTIARANDLWKESEFKNSFVEAAKTFIEDVEEGADVFSELFENYPSVYFLDAGDKKALFGKAILSDSELRENMEDLLKGLDLLFEKFDLKEKAETYLSEADEVEDEEGEEGEEAEADAPEEVGDEDKGKLLDDLKKVVEKIEDEDAKKKLDDLIEKYEKSIAEGTRADLVKEAVSLLTI